MKTKIPLLGLSLGIALLGQPAHAGPIFDATIDGDISVAGNWIGGLPTDMNDRGSIAKDGFVPDTTSGGVGPITDFYVDQTAGKIAFSNFNGTRHSGGEWDLQGGEYETRAFVLLNGSSFIVSGGLLDTGNNNKDTSITDGSSITMTSGTINLGRRLQVQGGSTFTMSGGTMTGSLTNTNNDFGFVNTSGGGSIFLNGGDITVANFTFAGSSGTATFGGSNAGSLVANDFGGNKHNDTLISLDFLSGTKMSMQLLNAAGWAETEWNENRLAYNGQTKSDLGDLTWGAVTSTGFGDTYAFNYDDGTNTLSLVVVPEPSSLALIGMGCVLVASRRRKSS